MAVTKNATTNVKYSKGGVENAADVPYTVILADSLDSAVEILKGKLSEEDAKADNAAELATNKVVEYVNQVLEANARQSARAAFMTTVEGPDKQILAMAKKLAAVKGITVEEAEKQVRALL
jgi:hypothetical protein